MDQTPTNQRKADHDAAQAKLQQELAQLAAIPPQSRTAAQNERLQQLEVQRQQLAKDAEAFDAEPGTTKGTADAKKHR